MVISIRISTLDLASVTRWVDARSGNSPPRTRGEIIRRALEVVAEVERGASAPESPAQAADWLIERFPEFSGNRAQLLEMAKELARETHSELYPVAGRDSCGMEIGMEEGEIDWKRRKDG